MRTLLALLFALGLTTSSTAQSNRLEPAKTYAVIAGVLEWESDTLSSFSKENRRDQGLYDRLLEMGIPAEQMSLLLGPEATNENMIAALDAIAQKAKGGSTLIFYYAGHGYPGSKGIYFASHDAAATIESPEGFWIGNIESIVKEKFKGDRILLFADCCFSGGLADIALRLKESGFRTASLTSSSLSNTSTGYWTFTCSLLDALGGRPLLDLDGNGKITLGEAAHDVRESMQLVESQNHGYSNSGVKGDFVLAEVDMTNKLGAAIPQPYALRQYMEVSGRGTRARAARIIDFREGMLGLEIQRYSKRDIIWKDPMELRTRDRPNLPHVPTYSKDLFPQALPDDIAEKTASVNGKYEGLLRKIEVRFDFLENGSFSDYGRWNAKQYKGHANLPPGYWVYVYPNWYIFGNQSNAKD
ncbi:MAG: caspase family protein [Planctomycetes bacterium]|nr:caspase family protein [Planctomycetota bacterium]